MNSKKNLERFKENLQLFDTSHILGGDNPRPYISPICITVSNSGPGWGLDLHKDDDIISLPNP